MTHPTPPTDPVDGIRKALAEIAVVDSGFDLHNAKAAFHEAATVDAIRELLDRLDSAERDAASVGSYWITRGASPIKVERVQQMGCPDKWAVRQDYYCLNHSGEWEMEPTPSSRDDEFLARCRFCSSREAIDAALRSVGEKEPK